MHIPCQPSEPWARLYVLRGAEPQSLRFQVDKPAQLSVGSSPAARLSVRGPNVAPLQFEVLWDGAALWLQDPLRLGRTFVNAQPLNEWCLIRGQALVCFAEIQVWAAAVSPHPAPELPDFASLERARVGSVSKYARRRMPTLRLRLDVGAEPEPSLSEASGS